MLAEKLLTALREKPKRCRVRRLKSALSLPPGVEPLLSKEQRTDRKDALAVIAKVCDGCMFKNRC